MRSSLFAVLLSGVTLVVAQTCYHPDGTRITDPAYQPCNQVTGTISQCCGTNHTGGIVAPDRCLPNGLCQNTGDSVYWRNGCTDPTFKSPNCLNICLDGSRGGDSSDNAPMQSCSGNTWCCKAGFGSRDCCSNVTARFTLPATIGQLLSISSTTTPPSSSTSPPSTSSTSSRSAPSPATSSNAPPENVTEANGGLSTGAKIGLGVGIPIGVLLLAGIIGAFLYRRKRDRKRFEASMQNHSNAPPVVEAAGKEMRRYEMDSQQAPVELEGNLREKDRKTRHEMHS